MKVFLSYAAEERDLADAIQLALRGADYEVFFDRESLPPAGDFHGRIRKAVEQSDFFVFLITPDSVAPGSYALTELKYARARWPHPRGRVLPVRLRDTPWDAIPGYLEAVTVLEPEGNVPAEVVAAIEGMHQELQTAAPPQTMPAPPPSAHARRRYVRAAMAIGLTATLGAVAIASYSPSPRPDRRDSTIVVQPEVDTLVAGPADTPTAPPVEDAARESVEIPQHKRALAISMMNETGRPRSYTAVYTFGGDLGYGQAFASLRSGTLHTLLRAYSEARGARFGDQVRESLPRVQRRDTTLRHDSAFIRLLVRVAGEDSVMLRLQDESAERGYLGPARRVSAELGVVTPLGFALIADTFLQSGPARYEQIKLATVRALDGTPATGINEKRWIRRFAEERIKRYEGHLFAAHIRDRTSRYITLMESGNWDLAAPVNLGRYSLIDP